MLARQKRVVLARHVAGVDAFGVIKNLLDVVKLQTGDLRIGVYVEKVLAPTLAEGDIVVLDNLGSHKGKPARAAVRAAGAHLLFLPPYSPDLNPIEQVFAKLKHLVRKARARAFDHTWKTVGDTLDAFAPDECANYLKNSGYVSV